MTKTVYQKIVIGRSEPVELVDFALSDIPAKVDTGAYRSAIQADNIQLTTDGRTLTFRLLGGHPLYDNLAKQVSTNTFRKVRVRSSFGHTQMRYAITLNIKLSEQIFAASFTLANRNKKPYPVLLGRELLRNRFIVDPAQAKVDGSELRRKLINAGIEAGEEEE